MHRSPLSSQKIGRSGPYIRAFVSECSLKTSRQLSSLTCSGPLTAGVCASRSSNGMFAGVEGHSTSSHFTRSLGHCGSTSTSASIPIPYVIRSLPPGPRRSNSRSAGASGRRCASARSPAGARLDSLSSPAPRVRSRRISCGSRGSASASASHPAISPHSFPPQHRYLMLVAGNAAASAFIAMQNSASNLV